MGQWWNGTSAERYAVGVYCIFCFIMAVLPLASALLVRNVAWLYLSKAMVLWSVTLVVLAWFCVQRPGFRREVFRDLMRDRRLRSLTLSVLATIAVSFIFTADHFLATFGTYQTYSGLVSWLCAALLTALLVPMTRLVPLRRLVDPAYVGFALVAPLIMVQFLRGDFLYGFGRLSGLVVFAGFGNRNYAAMPYVWLTLLAMSELANPATRSRRQSGLLILIGIYCAVIFASLTRAAWLGLIAGLAAAVAYLLRRRPSVFRAVAPRLAAATALALVELVLLNNLSDGAILGRYGDTVVALNGTAQALQMASSGRWELWRAGLARITSPWLWIVGIGPISLNLHNQYLECLVTTGFPGLIAFLALAAALLRRARRLAWADPTFLGPWLCLIALLVNLTLVSINMGFFLWFVPLLALIVAGGRLTKDGEPNGRAQPQ